MKKIIFIANVILISIICVFIFIGCLILINGCIFNGARETDLGALNFFIICLCLICKRYLPYIQKSYDDYRAEQRKNKEDEIVL